MTGDRPDEIDCIISLELGADDYIVRPSPRELLARARAILRRREMARAAQTRDPKGGGYRFNGWRLDVAFQEVVHSALTGEAEVVEA
jgi:DNA-binding response OmpR family regulator